jgi:hypothetical protein
MPPIILDISFPIGFMLVSFHSTEPSPVTPAVSAWFRAPRAVQRARRRCVQRSRRPRAAIVAAVRERSRTSASGRARGYDGGLALLEGLLSVNWAALNHAYGSAADVPGLLRALANPDRAAGAITEAARLGERSVRDEAIWQLWGNVFHQGSLYQASAKTVPFLVEILRDGPDEAELRSFLLSYLNHLALGYPSDLFPAPIDPDTMFRGAAGMDRTVLDAVEGKGYENLDDAERELCRRAGTFWAMECYLAVEARAADLAPFIDAPDDAVALEAIALAASFPRVGSAAIPFLRTQSETSAIRRGSAVVALARLIGPWALEDAERALAASDPLLALHGACALVLADPERVDPRAIEVLTAPAPDLHGATSPLTDRVGTLVARCLERVPEASRERVVDAIAHQHQSANALMRLSLTASMLRVLFGGKRPPASARDLTPLQRRAMEAIRDHGAWTVGTGIFGNYTLMLRGWGLPGEREAFARWLE